MKPLEKSSFLKTVLRALGMEKGSVSPSLSPAENKPGDSASYVPHGFTRTALLEAERAKAEAMIELKRKL